MTKQADENRSGAIDPVAFRQFEHSGWQSVAAGYHDYFEQLTRQAIEPLLDALHVEPGKAALDIATGPGYMADALARAGTQVTAIDFSSHMVARARELYSEITFIEADAEQLPFADEQFDLAVSNFGMLHFPRPERAVREAHRVLRNQGRFAFSVWSPPEQALGFKIILDAVFAAGNPDVPIPPGPPFFQFSRSEAAEGLLEQSGFANPATSVVQMTWRLASADAFFDAFYSGTPRTGGLLRAQTAEDLANIRQDVQARLAPYMVRQELQIPMSCLIAWGEKI